MILSPIPKKIYLFVIINKIKTNYFNNNTKKNNN